MITLTLGQTGFQLGNFGGLLIIPVVLFILKVSVFQLLFAFSLQVSFTVSSALLIGEIAGFFFMETTLFYSIFRLGATVLMYAVYVIGAVKNGKTLYEKIFAYGSTKEWMLYSFAGMMGYAIMVICRMTIFDRPVFPAVLFFILLSFAVLCYAIINTNEKTQKRIEAEFAKNLISSSREHYQKMNELYDKLRILRHDYKYHLRVAKNMLHSGNTEEANEYLTNAENQLLEYEMKRYCHNTVLNALITSYAERCAENNIEFSAKIIFPDSLSIPDYDMCIVLGNLLENAIEACLKLTENRSIALETHIKTTQLLIQVRNSYDGVIHDKNKVMISRKTNGGLGLRSVKEVLEHYSGDLLTEWDEHIFTAYAAVKI
jgi:sensor histidine kinase YesM